jgi:exopolysaccharide production protein ExoQ
VDRQRIPKLVYMGLLVCLISSIAFKFLNSRAAYDVNGAFMGVFTQKNVLGSMMTLLIFTSACLFLSRWRPFLTLGTAAAAAVVLVISKSGTGLITTVLTLLPIVLAFFLRRGGRTLAFGTGLILLAAGAACAIVAFLEIDVIGLVLSSVGKDSTLTGRTILWSFGMDAFETHPWLGFGYKGYWESTQSTVFYLRYVIGQNLWFFHNNFIEVAVAFGVMGPILLIAGIAQAFSRSLRVFVRDHQYLSLWYVLFVICVMLDAMVEYPLFLNHGLYQFLFVAVLASSSRAMTGPRRVLAAAGESK